MKKHVLLSGLVVIGSFILLSMTMITKIQVKPWKVPAKYEKLKNAYADVGDDEKIGRILYSKHCKSCHGSKGKGDGKKAGSIDTPVGDFTDGSFDNQSDGSLYYKTFFGRDDMPSFEKKVPDDEERWLIVNYIRSLAK